jgi:hypothetical protein
VKAALAPHIRALLAKDVSVVLDFAGNTRGQRPGSASWSTAPFDAITALFQAPADDEGFTVIRHVRD